MRSFMKSHRRGSSSDNTNIQQRPSLSISPTKVISSSASALNNHPSENNNNLVSASSDAKQVSPISGKTSRIKNFLKHKVSSTNLSLNTNVTHDTGTSNSSPTHSSPTSSVAAIAPHLKPSNSITNISPRLKQKSSFSSLSTLGLSSKKNAKSSGLNNNISLYDGASYIQSKASTSSPTIFGTKTHNWSSDEGPRALRINTEFAVSKNSLGGIHEEPRSRLNGPLEINFNGREEQDEEARNSFYSLSSSKKSEDQQTSPSSVSATKVRRLSGIVSETHLLGVQGKPIVSDLDSDDSDNELDSFSIKVLSSKDKSRAVEANKDANVVDTLEGGNVNVNEDFNESEVAKKNSNSKSVNDTKIINEDEDGGDMSIHSGASSQFSFQTNHRAGRNASIKYYKSKDQMTLENLQIKDSENHKRFIEETGVEDYELQEDMNYIDFNEYDETEELFNRKLFSSDEEENANGEDNYGEYDLNGMDDYADDTGEGYSSTHEFNDQHEISEIDKSETKRYTKSAGENSLDMKYESVSDSQEDDFDFKGNASSIKLRSNVSLVPKDLADLSNEAESQIEETGKNSPIAGSTNPNDLVKLLMKLQSSDEITHDSTSDNTLANKESTLTQVVSPEQSEVSRKDDPVSKLNKRFEPKRATTRKGIIRPTRARTPSIKYHQVDGTIDDNLDFLEKRYSWFPDESSDIVARDSITSENGSDYFSRDASIQPQQFLSDEYKGFDDSLIDEINQLPEDYDFENDERVSSPATGGGNDVPGLSPMGSFKSGRYSLRSLKSASSHKPLLRTTSSGNRIEMTDKTITLFKPISRNNSIRSNVSNYSETNNNSCNINNNINSSGVTNTVSTPTDSVNNRERLISASNGSHKRGHPYESLSYIQNIKDKKKHECENNLLETPSNSTSINNNNINIQALRSNSIDLLLTTIREGEKK